MKGLSAGLTFFNLSTVSAVFLGLLAGGLGPINAFTCLLIGAMAAVVAYFATNDPESMRHTASSPEREARLSKRAQRRLEKIGAQPATTTTTTTTAPGPRYRSVWFWLLAGCFATFAVRCFCWLLYIDGPELKIQSVNNLGDLSLHITYIKTFANGVPFWPDNPIYAFSKLRYPAGVDLFNALLCLVNVDLLRGFVWVGLLASLATFYAFYRWGGAFGVAGFLFNGGLAGFQFINSFEFRDYQGVNSIAWKSIPLSMFVTQRGLLYAIPAGLLLLWHWRQKFFSRPAASLENTVEAPATSAPPSDNDESFEAVSPVRRGPLPSWVEISIYASMPLFHVHTFLALTVVLVSLFFCGDALMRGQVLLVVAAALVPATFFVWLITDHFHAGSVLEWFPGWVLHTKNDFNMPFFTFWWVNFGIWLPLVLVLLGWTGWRLWKKRPVFGHKLPEEVAFLSAAVALFLIGLFVKTAPWEWDNLKLMFWGYFIVLPYLWAELIAQWALPLRVGTCIALFGSGLVSLFGGLVSPGYGFTNRAELAGVGVGIRNLPVDARFATWPTYNHPILLHGRKAVLGYPGHLWTQGFADYGKVDEKLRSLMLGQGDWQKTARDLGVRYIFWGREEKTNYPMSTRPWENVLPKVASGEWGTIYDCGAPKIAQ